MSTNLFRTRIGRLGRPVQALTLMLALLAGLLGLPTPQTAAAGVTGQVDLIGPEGSEWFGWGIHRLDNGNLLVIDPRYDEGAVYLYDGQTLELISKLTGSSPQDRVGSGGIVRSSLFLFEGMSVLGDGDRVGPTGMAQLGDLEYSNRSVVASTPACGRGREENNHNEEE